MAQADSTAPSPRPSAGLRARLDGARRWAALATGAALLAAGVAVSVSAPASVPVAAEAPAIVEAPADVTVLPATPSPPVVPVSHVQEEADATPAEEPASEGEPIGSGKASYYGAELAGHPTASGEAFDPADLTAAHRTLPFGTHVRVTNERTGASVVVRVNDRGPFHGQRVIDVSTAAAEEIGLKRAGTARVSLERLPRRGARG